MDDKQLRGWVSDQLHALLGFAEGSLAAYVVALGELLDQQQRPEKRNGHLLKIALAVAHRTDSLPLSLSLSIHSHNTPLVSPLSLLSSPSNNLSSLSSPSSRVSSTDRRRRTGKKASNPSALTQQLISQGLPDTGETKRFAADLLAKMPRAGGAGGSKGAGTSAAKRDERDAAKAAERNRGYAMLDDDDEEEEDKGAAKPSKAGLGAPGCQIASLRTRWPVMEYLVQRRLAVEQHRTQSPMIRVALTPGGCQVYMEHTGCYR
jgi:hypothetical protein